MKHQLISATKAMRTFSEILNCVHYQRKTFDIERGKKIIASIVPTANSHTLKVKELNEFFANAPKLSGKDAKDFLDDVSKARKQTKLAKNKWD